jgi:DNA-binding transcriptional regulator YdaS (Cro superfamily)
MQWCSGHRPVPALRAKTISDLLGGDPAPGELSAKYEAFAAMFKEIV